MFNRHNRVTYIPRCTYVYTSRLEFGEIKSPVAVAVPPGVSRHQARRRGKRVSPPLNRNATERGPGDDSGVDYS